MLLKFDNKLIYNVIYRYKDSRLGYKRSRRGRLRSNRDGLFFIPISNYSIAGYLAEREVKSVAGKEPTAKGKLFAILGFYREYPTRPPMKGGCPVLNFGAEADDTNPLVKKRVNEVILHFQESIGKLVQRGIRDGEFRADWDAGLFAIKMYALIEGGIMISRIQGNTRQMGLIIDLLKEEIAGSSL